MNRPMSMVVCWLALLLTSLFYHLGTIVRRRRLFFFLYFSDAIKLKVAENNKKKRVNIRLIKGKRSLRWAVDFFHNKKLFDSMTFGN